MKEQFRPTVIRNKAWDALKGKWGVSALICLVFFVIAGVIGTIGGLTVFLSLPIQLLVASMISIGAYFVWLDVANGKEVEIKTLFEPFNDYVRYLVGYLLVFIYTLLWSLLLIIPGIIKSISYGMTFFIMRENPEMKGEEAIQLSMKMMDGHKMDFFLLQFSFIGWVILGTIALGIGLLWVLPYMYTATGKFYETVKADYAERLAAGRAA